MRTFSHIATCLVLVAAHAAAAAADTYPRQSGVDAVHYVFRLHVGDGSNEIAGEATATIRITAPGVKELHLDLASPQDGKGMTVSSVTVAGKPVHYSHEGNRLRVPLDSPAPGSDVTVDVAYRGVPAGGLRLIANIHGDRSIFSENWPNNARHWLPAIDHPYDKATGEFVVTAPAHYQVVANGLLVSEIDRPDGQRTTRWRQSVPIASWLFALGVARFSVEHYAMVRGIPQQIWSFPQDREAASGLFALTGRRAFEFFSDWIGPYPYEKLAHVQAAGLGGGTEHASAIFYGEKGVAAGRGPVVHEVAHQWWGNAVTERDWDDVWLSEGFATYFTHLFTEHFSGREAFVRGLKNDIDTILQAQLKLPDQAVIHRNIDDMRGVLNRFVYQKGGWVLHMLRGTIGTDAFWDGIREYYRRYRDANASTSDLRQVMEQVSGRDLGWFFDQWLTRPGMPKLAGTWRYDRAAGRIELEIAQTQSGAPYRLPLDVAVTLASGAPRVHRVELTGATGMFTIPVDAEPASVSLDPNTWLLLESANLRRGQKAAPEFSLRSSGPPQRSSGAECRCAAVVLHGVDSSGALDPLLDIIRSLTGPELDDTEIGKAVPDEWILGSDGFDHLSTPADGEDDAAIPWNLAARDQEVAGGVVLPQEPDVGGHAGIDLGEAGFVGQLDDEHGRSACTRHIPA